LLALREVEAGDVRNGDGNFRQGGWDWEHAIVVDVRLVRRDPVGDRLAEDQVGRLGRFVENKDVAVEDDQTGLVRTLRRPDETTAQKERCSDEQRDESPANHSWT